MRLDDGILNTCFENWRTAKDPILSDLAQRFLDRQPLKSVRVTEEQADLLPKLASLVTNSGYDANYYTATNDSFNLPYALYDSKAKINLIQPNGDLEELSEVSPLVKAVTDKELGDERFFFPKQMLGTPEDQQEVFQPYYQEFSEHIKNDRLI